MRYEVKQDPNDASQWVIWDNLDNYAFARFSEKAKADEIVNKWYEKQMAAEMSGA
jgi:hypothetical protein